MYDSLGEPASVDGGSGTPRRSNAKAGRGCDHLSRLTGPTFLLIGAAGGAVATGVRRSANLRAVREAFRRWSAGEGSLSDLMTDDAVIVIPGTAPHCGTFSKTVFARDVAAPFMARFSRPPAPRASRIWSDGNDIAVLAEAEGTRRDGKPYANSYVFILKMRGGRIVQTTEFLDMRAFNDVWDHVEPESNVAAATEQHR